MCGKMIKYWLSVFSAISLWHNQMHSTPFANDYGPWVLLTNIATKIWNLTNFCIKILFYIHLSNLLQINVSNIFLQWVLQGKLCKKKTNCPFLDTHCKHLVQYFMNKSTKLNVNKNVWRRASVQELHSNIQEKPSLII